MDRLSAILDSCTSPEPEKSMASSWSFRQQKAAERWKEARPYHLKCLTDAEAVGHPQCCRCLQPAIISLHSANSEDSQLLLWERKLHAISGQTSDFNQHQWAL